MLMRNIDVNHYTTGKDDWTTLSWVIFPCTGLHRLGLIAVGGGPMIAQVFNMSQICCTALPPPLFNCGTLQ
jgi:hypothetical protein